MGEDGAAATMNEGSAVTTATEDDDGCGQPWWAAVVPTTHRRPASESMGMEEDGNKAGTRFTDMHRSDSDVVPEVEADSIVVDAAEQFTLLPAGCLRFMYVPRRRPRGE